MWLGKYVSWGGWGGFVDHVKSRASVFRIRDAALTSLPVFAVRLNLPIEFTGASGSEVTCQV